jgi:hypothetical protein
VLGCEAIDPDSDTDSDTDLDETMKDMKLHENQEFPLAFQKNPSDAPKNLRNLCKSVDKNPSSAIPCVLWLNNRSR